MLSGDWPLLGRTAHECTWIWNTKKTKDASHSLSPRQSFMRSEYCELSSRQVHVATSRSSVGSVGCAHRACQGANNQDLGKQGQR